ncbi:hypothetical protein B9Z55_018269 [Caenorhabditis nigoni]|uniref:Uncharacterized protein n=1 Tax=Caenorhabditis nigoni TaxID=1611254 RepID=A0A2G5TD27_9PELO|nr:hypothetical protein B9Z55_018269 [Caenorhabditis nigoni]
MNQLAEDLVENNFWGNEDAKLMMMFLSDLKLMGFEFPEILKGEYLEPFMASANETERNANCRRMNLEFELVDPKNYDSQISILQNFEIMTLGDRRILRFRDSEIPRFRDSEILRS